MCNHKPWKPFSDQLEILKNRGLLVDNEPAALDYLGRIGYYRLSGYWYTFRKLEITQDEVGGLGYFRHNEFLEGSHFQDAVHLYVFDKKLRLLALDALERIELAIRVDIAHLLGEQDTYAHEAPELFHGNFTKLKQNGDQSAHQDWLDKYQSLVHRARRVPFVEHYLSKYGKLPIWVAIEIWDFGLLSKLFAGMQYKHKQQIAAKYGAKDGRALEGWLRGLNFIRNVSAHHSRLWNINVLERAAHLRENEFWMNLNNARPFYYFCLMKKLMDVICPNSSWSQRFIDLTNEFPDVGCKSVNLSDFGVIENWSESEFWKQE